MAVVMITLFILICVAGRVILQYKLTGDHGIRPAWHSVSPTVRMISAIVSGSMLGMLVLGILHSTGAASTETNFGLIGTVLGSLICITGIAVTSISQIQMGRQWRIGVNPDEKTQLVSQGMFSFARNPIYSGVLLFCLGLLILVPHSLMLFFFIVSYVGIDLYVYLVEEPYLLSLHGEKFQNYQKKTGRYFPRFFRLTRKKKSDS